MSNRQLLYHIARIGLVLAVVVLGTASLSPAPVQAQGADNPVPPENTVKLIFIHHSTGENWLNDGWGGLGRSLADNNYYVSDTNYGWGPDSIGDRTDIPNWPEWFTGPDSARYMQALYNESEQHAEYSRGSLTDPGGENQIILFKSCFPNSNLEGNPGDPPQEGYDYTVGNAKYIYNDLLNYFRTRQDKLFIVITAPPVQDPSYADNARAFNRWLVYDWLRENNYPYNNVAVFDFYNVLTHPDNHHRFESGQIEHLISSPQNTLYYPSDDDHPNPSGSRKATAEFIPLLNVYYHRWQSGGAVVLPPTEAPGGEEIGEPIVAPPPFTAVELIDDFESGAPPDTDGWHAWWDEATQSTGTCGPEGGEPYSGSQALHITYSVVPESWLTCALLYNSVHNWASSTGISFYVRALQTGLWFDVLVYSGTPANLAGYERTGIETTQEMVDGWGYLEIPWSEILGVEWEQNAGVPINPTVVTGIAFGFGDDFPINGEIWVDDIHLMGGAQPELIVPPPSASQATEESAEPEEQQPEVEEVEEEEEEEEESGGSRLPCPSPMVMGMLLVAVLLWARHR